MADIQKRDYSLQFPAEGIIGRDADTLRFLQQRRARKAAGHAVKAKNTSLQDRKILLAYIRNHKIDLVRGTAENLLAVTHDGLQSIFDDLFGIATVLKQDLELAQKFFKSNGAQMSLNDLELAEKFMAQRRLILEAIRKYVDELLAAMNGKEIAEGALNIELLKYNTSSFFHPVKNFFEWWNMRSATRNVFKIEDRMKHIEEKSKPSENDFKHFLQYDKEYTQDLVMTLKNFSIYLLILIRNADTVGEDLVKAAASYDVPASFKDFGEEFVFMLNDVNSALKSLNKARLQLSDMAVNANGALDEAKKQREKTEIELRKAA
jgi:hypothetical protein